MPVTTFQNSGTERVLRIGSRVGTVEKSEYAGAEILRTGGGAAAIPTPVKAG